MDSSDFLTPEILLSSILVSVNDTEIRNGFSKGQYLSWLQEGLDEMAQDSFYNKLTLDFKFPVDTLKMPMPPNTFNLSYLYGWTGKCCSPQTSQKIWLKKNYNNKGGDGMGSTADVKEGTNVSVDPFIPQFWSGESVYYANVMNGIIMFSPSCQSFESVRLIVNGFGVEIGDVPSIPRFFRQAMVDYVRVMFYRSQMAKEPRVYRVLYQEALNALEHPVKGSWRKARVRVSQMNTFEKKSYEEYYGRMNY